MELLTSQPRLPTALVLALLAGCGDSTSTTSSAGSDSETDATETSSGTTGASTDPASTESGSDGATDSGTTTDDATSTASSSTGDPSTSTSGVPTTDGTTTNATQGTSTTGEDSDTGDCVPGSEGCACGPDDACDDGLECQDQLCEVAPFCGDGNVDVDDGEACDDGNADPDDGCEADCSFTLDAVLWSVTLGPPNVNSGAYGVALDDEGSIFVAGTLIDENLRKAWLGKFAPDGELVWEYKLEEFMSSEGQAVALDPDGAPFLVGRASPMGNPAGNNIWAGKLSPEGALEWSHEFDSAPNSNDGGFAAASDDAGDFYLVGNIQPGGQGGLVDAFVRKLDADGGELWTDVYGPGTGVAIDLDSEGRPVVSGTSSITMEDTLIGSSAWIRKYTAAGAVIWDITHEPAADCAKRFNYGNAVAIDPAADDMVYVVGEECLKVGGSAVLRLKYGANGLMKWSEPHDDANATFELAHGGALDPEGNVIAVGQRTSANNDQGVNIFALSSNPDGEGLWVTGFDIDHSFDAAHDVAYYPDGTLILVGRTGPLPTQSKIWIAKYNPPG